MSTFHFPVGCAAFYDKLRNTYCSQIYSHREIL